MVLTPSLPRLLQDLIIFPDDCEFKRVPQCPSGRVYVLKFKAGSKRLFFWMQVHGSFCLHFVFSCRQETGEGHAQQVAELALEAGRCGLSVLAFHFTGPCVAFREGWGAASRARRLWLGPECLSGCGVLWQAAWVCGPGPCSVPRRAVGCGWSPSALKGHKDPRAEAG